MTAGSTAPVLSRPAAWLTLATLCAGVDFATGPVIQFPAVYLAPIGLSAWHGGRAWGMTLAIILPLLRLAFMAVWTAPWTVPDAILNAVIRVLVFASFAWLVSRTATQMRELERTQMLEGLLGVCSVCKRIHNERDGEWQPLDAYLRSRPPQAQPDVCPRCIAEAQRVFERR